MFVFKNEESEIEELLNIGGKVMYICGFKKILKIFLYCFTLLLISCGADDQGYRDENEGKEKDDITYLQLLADSIKGTYEGVVEMANHSREPVPVRITLFVVNENVGNNNSGEPQLRPSLKGRFRRLDLISEINSFLIVKYFPSNGKILMRSDDEKSPGQGVPGGGTISLTGYINDGVLIGEVVDYLGPMGVFTGSLVTQ